MTALDGAERSSVEDAGAVAEDHDAVLDMEANRGGEDGALHVGASSDEVLDAVSVADPFDVLGDDRSRHRARL